MTGDQIFTLSINWDTRPSAADVAALPGKPAVFVMEDAGGAAVQLMVSQSLRRSLQSRLIDAAEEGGRADLGEIVRGVRWRPVASAFEGRWWHWRAVRQFYPRAYRAQLAFGPSYYLHLTQSPAAVGVDRAHLAGPAAAGVDRAHLAGPAVSRSPLPEADASDERVEKQGLARLYGRDRARPLPSRGADGNEQAQFGQSLPVRNDESQLAQRPPAVRNDESYLAQRPPVREIRVTEHIWREAGEYIGPWPTRSAAQQGLESLWDLFDLCRYPEQIRKSPLGVRCAYADMGRCDAPCDGSVPMANHDERLRAAWRFAVEGPAEVSAEIAARMKTAASELRFELAGQLRERQQSVARWHTHGAIRPIHDSAMRVLMAIPAAGRRRFRCFWFDRGTLIAGPDARRVELSAVASAWLKSVLAGEGEKRAEQASTDEPQSAPASIQEANHEKSQEESIAVLRAEQTWLVHHFLGHEDARLAVVITAETGIGVGDLSGESEFESIRAEIDRQVERISATAQTSEGDASTAADGAPEGDVASRKTPP